MRLRTTAEQVGEPTLHGFGVPLQCPAARTAFFGTSPVWRETPWSAAAGISPASQPVL